MIYAEDLTKVKNKPLLPVAISITTGYGQAYGGTDVYGVGFDIEYSLYNLHHFSLLSGTGKRYAGDDFWMWSGGFRYAYGATDRIFLGVLFGTSEVTKHERHEDVFDGEVEITDEYDVQKAVSLFTGYQRITSFGAVFFIGGGLALNNDKKIDADTRITFGFGYRI